jgi:5'-nucleotidase
MAIGNHEFDFGPEVLADFIEGFASGVPFLSANLDVSGEPDLAALAAAGRIAGSTIVEENGELIGIVGATTPGLPNISSPRNVTVDPDVAGAIQDEVDALTAAGVNKIVLISHLQNIQEDLALAPMLDGVDVMIAGGGDEMLANYGDPLVPGDQRSSAFTYPLTAKDKDGTSIPVITTPGDYKYVGRLIVGFDRKGNLVTVDTETSGPVRVSGNPADADSVAGDPTVIDQVVEPVSAFLAELASNILAVSDVPLNGLRGTQTEETVTVAGVRNSETNLGDLTADSLLWQAQQKAAEFGVDPPQVAFQNGGGIRNNSVIPPGNISELNTFEILAFTNFVSVKEDLTAADLKTLLETSVSEIGNGRYSQWAGVTFTFDTDLQARVIDPVTCAVSNDGARVLDVTVDGVQIYDEGAPTAAAGGFTVDLATNDFTFRGGDCYQFTPGFTTVGVTYQQALANYLVAPTADGGLGGVISGTDYPVGGAGRIVRL